MSTRSASDAAVALGAGRRRVVLGALVWMCAVQFFVMQGVVQSAWTTPFGLTRNFISDLGNTECAPYPSGSETYVCSPWHAWMNASFIAIGFTVLVGIALVGRAFPPGRARALGLALVALAGPGFILVGCFPENVNLPLHKLGAGLQFVGSNLGVAVLGIGMWRARQGLQGAVFSVLAGSVGLVATALFVTGNFLGAGIGGMERLAAYPLPIWLVVKGFWLARDPDILRDA